MRPCLLSFLSLPLPSATREAHPAPPRLSPEEPAPVHPDLRLSRNRRPPWLRIGMVAVLAFTLSGWTCTAIVGFNSCLGIPPSPQITSLSPSVISTSVTSVVLIVIGNGFVPQSQILLNGSTMPTRFVDSQHLQTTITQQTFEQFSVASGSSVLISVNSPMTTTVVGCPVPGSSSTLVLAIT
jgi:hypothetical protein